MFECDAHQLSPRNINDSFAVDLSTRRVKYPFLNLFATQIISAAQVIFGANNKNSRFGGSGRPARRFPTGRSAASFRNRNCQRTTNAFHRGRPN